MAAAICWLGGCGSQYAGSTLGQQVQSWATTSPDPKFASALSTLRSDISRLATAEASNERSVLRTACDVLITDALSANQNLPTPDSELSDLLSRAYTYAADSGRDCLCASGGGGCRAGEPSGTQLLDRSEAEGSAAERGFISAEARFDFLTTFSGGSA